MVYVKAVLVAEILYRQKKTDIQLVFSVKRYISVTVDMPYSDFYL